MQTRRDQLHAYRFVTRRAISALVTGEPDAVEPPMRRLVVTTISGIMVAIVVAAVFAVIGLLKGGGGDDWRADGSVVVEEETGARFVMIDGKLHPAVNYASAVLATGSSNPVTVHTVNRDELKGVERDSTIGIPGLPDAMPAAEDLVKGPISICSEAESQGVDVTAAVHIRIGDDSATEGVDPDEALYVQSFDGERYLLRDGQRHRVDSAVEPALQISEDPAPVGSAFLSAIPQGTPFETPRLDGMGDRTDVAGRTMRVGQVINVDDDTFRVVLADGIADITDVQAKLLTTAKLDGKRREPVAMSLSEVLDMNESDAMEGVMERLPATMPTMSSAATQTGGACVVFDEDSNQLQVAVPEGGDTAGVPKSESGASRSGSADDVMLEPGAGLLARTPDSATVYLIGEPGRAYPTKGADVLASFGYADEEPVTVPSEFLGAIPHGEALDPGRARQPVQQ